MVKYRATSGGGGLRKAVIAAAILSAFAFAPAYATPLVTQWDFSGNALFDDATNTDGNAINPTVNQLGTADTALCWGTAAGGGSAVSPCGHVHNGKPELNEQSSLVINPSGNASPPPAMLYQGSTIPPPASFVTSLFTLTHNNEPIYAPSLRHADIEVDLSLTPDDGSGSAAIPFSPVFGIDFDETPNVAGTCPVNPTPGNIPCPDIFVLDENTLNQSFSYNGNDYFVSFFAEDDAGNLLGTLPDAACEAAGASDGCFGFITQENKSNPFNMGFAISSQKVGPPPVGVPEPGELGLLGLGGLLIGFGTWRHRKEARRS